MTYLGNSSIPLTPDEELILADLVALGEPGQVPVVNSSATSIEYVYLNSSQVASSLTNLTQTYGVINVVCNAISGNITVRLPVALNNTATFNVKKIDASVNTVTIVPFGQETVDGYSSKIIQFKNTNLQLVSTGANWIIV
jgi:hypothetical protein